MRKRKKKCSGRGKQKKSGGVKKQYKCGGVGGGAGESNTINVVVVQRKQ